MEPVLKEFLGLLCRFCGASSARIRILSVAGGEGGAIVDLDLCRRCRPALEFGLREAPGYVEQFGSWLLENPGGSNHWRLEREIGGMPVIVDLELNEKDSGFIQKRLATATDLSGMLDHLVQVCTLSTDPLPETTEPFDPPIVGSSPRIRELRSKILKLAGCDIPVLINGESGTGKELVARNLHSLGPRAGGPMVSVNCMELPPDLLQSELFGNVRGAFTSADRDRTGLIASADGGTFFLDEIGELPGRMQAALLRVLQEKEVRRVGESTCRKVDVRFVFATNTDLEALVRKRKFRVDLYYRIAAGRLTVPPLRERKEDIPSLAIMFLGEFSDRSKGGPGGFSARAISAMMRYRWPGNVRELRNEVERTAAMNPGASRILPGMLSISENRFCCRVNNATGWEDGTLPEAIMALERKMIDKALRDTGGNKTRTAEALGITRQGLLKKMRRLGVEYVETGPTAHVISEEPLSL
jgi:DNA-binding NtrC family response regulator